MHVYFRIFPQQFQDPYSSFGSTIFLNLCLLVAILMWPLWMDYIIGRICLVNCMFWLGDLCQLLRKCLDYFGNKCWCWFGGWLLKVVWCIFLQLGEWMKWNLSLSNFPKLFNIFNFFQFNELEQLSAHFQTDLIFQAKCVFFI